jgi:Domain of Unknown Function (DUF928)
MKPAIACSLLTATFLVQPTHIQNGATAASQVEANVGMLPNATPSFTGNQPSAKPSSLLAALPQQSQPTPDPKSPAAPANNKPKRKVLDADLSGFDISDPKSEKKVTTMLGASRTAAIPSATLLAPKRAKFYGQSATFDWSFAGHNEGYILIITDEDETQLVHLQLKETRYRLETSAIKFQPGQTYYWRVQVLPNPLASEPLEFEVVSAEEQQAITTAIAAIPTTNPYQAALAKAQILTDRRLWFDALGAYDDLIAKYPERSELYNQRGAIYAQIPATKSQSESDFARADKSPQ